MVFSSHLFIFVFLPVCLLLYFLMPRRARNAFLTAASYLFYGWSNPLFMILLLVSTFVDYFCGRIIARPVHPFGRDPLPLLIPDTPRSRTQKVALVCALSSNLIILGFFKYFNFAFDSAQTFTSAIGLPHLIPDVAFRVTLPLGISFYTFQSMSYTIDVYRGHARAIRSFMDFACFVSMFPQLVAGPIIRFSEVADQLQNRNHSMAKFSRGIAFFVLGLAKKILLANPCGKVASTVFQASSQSVLDAWYGAISYAFQIYFDFSGYSDMAIGLGLMLGFVFAKNFDAPYSSQSITEFWRRWHISLSSWLRDYLYIPLGGNRLGSFRTYANIAIVMLLGGLWHGAAWNFVVWGGLHGLMLIVERARSKQSFYNRMPGLFRTAITFVIVLFTWVFFRSPDLSSALVYCGRMFGLGTTLDSALLMDGLIYQPYYLLTFAACAVFTWLGPQAWEWTRNLTVTKVFLVFLLFVFAIMLLITQAYNPFIYFIF